MPKSDPYVLHLNDEIRIIHSLLCDHSMVSEDNYSDNAISNEAYFHDQDTLLNQFYSSLVFSVFHVHS